MDYQLLKVFVDDIMVRLRTHMALANAHHEPYTDADAQALIDTHAAIVSAHHTRYTDSEAVAALQNTNPTFATTKISNLDEGEIPFPDAAHKLITDNALFWDNTNKRLGIGTNTPERPIHVSPTVDIMKFYGQCPTNNRAVLIVGNELAGGHYGYLSYHGVNLTNDWGYPDSYGANRTIFQGSGGGFVIIAYMDAFIRFNTQHTSRIEIASDGKVGINTKSPTAQLDVNSNIFRLRTAKTPATAGAAGNAGDFCWDADYFYICMATNTWRRVAHATW